MTNARQCLLNQQELYLKWLALTQIKVKADVRREVCIDDISLTGCCKKKCANKYTQDDLRKWRHMYTSGTNQVDRKKVLIDLMQGTSSEERGFKLMNKPVCKTFLMTLFSGEKLWHYMPFFDSIVCQIMACHAIFQF